MYELSELNEYYVVNHPILTKSKKKLIEEKLTLDEQVRRQVEDRERDDNFFLNYRRNPFSHPSSRQNPNAQRHPNEAMERKKSTKQRVKTHEDKQGAQRPKPTIVEAFNEIKENKFVRDC